MEKGLYSGDEEEALPLNSKAGGGGFYRWVHRQLKGWWTPRLLLDWAVLVLILVIDVPVSMTTDPYDRFVTAGDPSLSYPLMSDTVREQKSFNCEVNNIVAGSYLGCGVDDACSSLHFSELSAFNAQPT